MADTKISALSAVATPAGTDAFPVAQGGVSKKATLDQIKTYANTAPVFAAGSASAGSWPTMTPGTLLTTPEDGAIEMDADCLYATTDAGNRGYVPVRYLIRADGTVTYSSATTAQNIFTSPTNGRLTLEAGTYLMEGMLAFTSMSATSGNLRFDFKGGGSATLGAMLMYTTGLDAAAAATPGAVGGQWVATNINTTNAITAATGAAMLLNVRGTFEVTGAGTIQPQLLLTTAAAAVLSIGSYLAFERIGSTSLVSIGQWD